MIITTSFEITMLSGVAANYCTSGGCVACVDKESLAFWLASTYTARNFKEVWLDLTSIKAEYGRNPAASWMGRLI